jgi:surface antigen
VIAGVPSRLSSRLSSRVSVLRYPDMRSYRGCPTARLWCTLVAAACSVTLGLSLGGCSSSYQLDNMFAKKEESSLTGTLQPSAAPAASPVATLPPEGDLVLARAAVSEVMSKGGKDTSISWENPKTGARGTVTPIASARNGDDGQTCHEFLASFEREGGSSSWMQGEACRASSKGKWEVRTLKPWQQRT